VILLDGVARPFGLLRNGEGPFERADHLDGQQVYARQHRRQVTGIGRPRTAQQYRLAVAPGHLYRLGYQIAAADRLDDDARAAPVVARSRPPTGHFDRINLGRVEDLADAALTGQVE